MFLTKIFTGASNVSDYLGVLVLGSVSGGLIWFALKTRKQLSNDIAQAQIEMHEAERAEDIQCQAEAILLAEEMKKSETAHSLRYTCIRKNKRPVGHEQANTDPGILPLACLLVVTLGGNQADFHQRPGILQSVSGFISNSKFMLPAM